MTHEMFTERNGNRCTIAPDQLELPGMTTTGATIDAEMRERLLALAARVRDAVRACTHPAVAQRLDTAYVLFPWFAHDRFAWCVLGANGSVVWLTRRLFTPLVREQRFPFRLWGRVACRLEVSPLSPTDDTDPLSDFDTVAYVSADVRLGATVFTQSMFAHGATPLAVFAARPIPGWPA